MNDKNKLKILAEAIVGNHINIRRDCDIQYCIHCDQQESYNGKEYVIQHCAGTENYCPVLLAEQILKEVPKDKGMLKYLKPVVDGLRKEGAIFVPPVMCGSECTYPDDECPHCKEGSIESVKGTEPYSEDYLMCNKCDSTFNKEDKKPMKLYELQHYVDKLIAQGYSDVPVYFDTEAKSYDCHIVPIGSINIVPEEAVGEDHIVLSEYIEKPEDPLIVHNVMTYRGKNYLKQRYEQNHDCDICGLSHTNIDDCREKTQCNRENDFYWKSFDDIKITDELACMRKDIGDIYLYNIQENKIDKLTYVEDGRKSYVHTIGWRSTNDNMRLATAEEIQKYLEDKK